jgi:hypothetical protein
MRLRVHVALCFVPLPPVALGLTAPTWSSSHPVTLWSVAVFRNHFHEIYILLSFSFSSRLPSSHLPLIHHLISCYDSCTFRSSFLLNSKTIITYVILYRPLLWSSGQSFWLQIQRDGFDFRRYRIFGEVMGLERGPLSLMSTIERKSSGFGLEIREYGRRDPSRWPRGTLYPRKLALTSPTSGGHSVGIVRSRTLATEFSLVVLNNLGTSISHYGE